MFEGGKGLRVTNVSGMRWISIFGIVLMLLLAPVSAEGNKIPVNEFKGRVTFVRDAQVAVVQGSKYVLVTVDDSTYKEGLVERGVNATVIYRVGDNMALKIFTDKEDPEAEAEENGKKKKP